MEIIMKETCIFQRKMVKEFINGVGLRKAKYNIEGSLKKIILKDSLLLSLEMDKFMKEK